MTTRISVSSLPLVTHNSIRVITTELLAKLYGTDPARIRKNHHRNLDRFTENKHYFKATGDELASLRVSLRHSQNPVAGRARTLMLWTERGAARHAKMLETDQAWEVFSQLEDFYFSARSENADTIIPRFQEMVDRLTDTPERFVSLFDGNLITSSMLVAVVFNADHTDVVRSVESLDIPTNFSSANFYAHDQKICTGKGPARVSKVYRMTKDGFMLLAMGFTGHKAMVIKTAYINAFNRMAAELEKQKPQGIVDKQRSFAEIAEKSASSNQQLMSDPHYRIEARDYAAGALDSCRKAGADLAGWEPVDQEKVVSGLLADLLFGVRAEVSFNTKLEPQFKVIPAGATYIDLNNQAVMVGITERGVSEETLAAMLQAGIRRLASK